MQIPFPFWWNWSIGLTILTFFAAMVLALLSLRIFKLWERPKF